MDDVREAFQRLAAALHARPEVLTAYVFGSAAGSAGAGSRPPRDLDVAVITGGESGLAELLGLQVELERAAAVPVDLHEFDRLPVDLQFRVVREGSIVVDRDPAARVRNEIRVMNAYHDLAPYLERIRSGTRERLARSGGGDG